MFYAAAFVIGLLLGGGILFIWLRRQCALAESVESLVQAMGREWEPSAQRLVQQLVAPGMAESAFLFAIIDDEKFSLQASAVRHGQPVWESDGEQLGRQALVSGLPALRAGNRLFVPLRCEGDPVGLLVVADLPKAAEVALLGVAGHLAAIGLASFFDGQQQEARSNTDGLTGLVNHRRFQQMLAAAFGPAYLAGEPLALILLDIDHFKMVNDTYGHLFGDQVLRELSYLIKRHLPQGATAARYGGEELAILVQGELALGAPELAERLRLLIEGSVFMDVESGVLAKITISLGVATYQLGQGKQKLLSRADDALYASKHGGRNKVTVAPVESHTLTTQPS